MFLLSPRLSFRHLQPSDLDSLYELYRDPVVQRYIPEGVLTRAQTQQEVEWRRNGWPDHPTLGLWATIHKASQRFIGRCGLLPWQIEGRAEIEVAFMPAPAYWGQGLATEAAAAIAAHAFRTLKLDRLICLVTPGNDVSARVATKIGMHFERDIVDEHGPAWVYVMASHWLATSKPVAHPIRIRSRCRRSQFCVGWPRARSRRTHGKASP